MDLVSQNHYDFFNRSLDLLCIISFKGCLLEVNNSWERILGYPEDEVTSTPYIELIHPDDINTTVEVIDRTKKGETIEGFQNRYRCREGHYKWLSWNFTSNRLTELIYASARDIDGLKIKEKKTYYHQQYFQALFKNSSDAIAFFNERHLILDINEQFTNIFGYTLDEVLNQNLDNVLAINEQYNEATSITEKLLKGEEVTAESIRYDKNKNPIYVAIRGVPVIINGRTIAGYGIYTDITEKKKSEDELRYLSLHDQLTGLYNRVYFENQLQEINRLGRLPYALILGDVNGLKLVNDAFGHIAGDSLLKKIAAIIKKVCRKEDIVARIGGDEFGIILPNTSQDEAQAVIQRIEGACKQEEEDPIQPSIALGLAVKANPLKSIEEIYKKAEDQMYNEKLTKSKNTKDAIIKSMKEVLRLKSDTIKCDESRLRKLSIRMGERLGLNQNQLDDMETLVLFHDIGKIGLPDHLINKEGPLTEEEREMMKKHCEIGYRIANTSPELSGVAEAILSHHEHWDGSGFPEGKKGEEIPLLARIFAIVDTYISMIKSFDDAHEKQRVLEKITKESGRQFDPKLVDIFNEIIH